MLLITLIANCWWLFLILCPLGIISAFGLGFLGAEKENLWVIGTAFASGVIAWASGWLFCFSLLINLVIFIIKAVQ